MYHSLNLHVVITAVCKQTPNIYASLTFVLLCHSFWYIFDILSKIRNGQTIAAFNFLQCYCATPICFLISRFILISHHYNSCFSFSPCHSSSDTNLNLCIIILVTVFQWLWNLFAFGNSFIASDFLLNATIIFLFANITLISHIR